MFIVELFKSGPSKLPFIIDDQYSRDLEVTNDGPPNEIYYFIFGDASQWLKLHILSEVINND